MVQPAEDRPSNELAEPLDRPTARRVLVQGLVSSQFVAIGGVSREDQTKSSRSATANLGFEGRPDAARSVDVAA
jgi:hypothetical protein